LGWAGVWGCGGDALSEDERQEALRLFRLGAGFESDAYVRAETLRVLEALGDKRLVGLAQGRTEDPDPMVRVAALRVLHSLKHEDADRLTLAEYNKASDEGRMVLLSLAREFGRDELLQQLIAQALRSKNRLLKQRAFEYGPFQQLEAALKNDDMDALRRTIIPEVGKLVDGADEEIAGLALRRLLALGEADRAKPFYKTLQDPAAASDARVRAARVLWRARSKDALPLYQAILAEARDDSKALDLVLPQKKRDPALERAAVLGAVALGDATLLNRAQDYLKNASEEATIEVLEALAENPDEAAVVSLKIGMTDARPAVRRRAIALYGARPSAEPRALINALRQQDPQARKQLATILAARFPDEWSQDLRLQLRAEESVDVALVLMRDVLTKDDAKVLTPLQEELARRASEPGKDERAAIAAYLLLLSAPKDTKYHEMLRARSDLATRYIFLEYLMRKTPRESAATFREFIRDDLFAIRLMSAAGLWRAYEVKASE
jgi:hypothetical protein